MTGTPVPQLVKLVMTVPELRELRCLMADNRCIQQNWRHLPMGGQAGNLPLEGLLVHYIRHFSNVTAVVLLEHIHQALYASSRHAFVRIRREPGYARAAGKMMEKAAAVFQLWIAQRRILGQGLLL